MNDARIRDLLARAHEAEPVPAFERMVIGRTRRVPVRPWLAFGLSVAALLAVVGLGWRLTVPPSPANTQRVPLPDLMATASWRAPTDFLLETPGIKLLREQPRLFDPTEPSPGALP